MPENKYKRVVVKVGTSTLTYDNGKINFNRIEKLAMVLSDLSNRGCDVILVTSGSIAVGVSKLGLERRPETIPEKQAAAAVGQCELMNIYERFFAVYNLPVAQILLTRDCIENQERRLNAINTFNTLLSLNVIPIVNENDTVSVEEINFGDNDTLSAYVSVLTQADLLVLLTDIDGLYDKNPRTCADAELITTVHSIDDSVRALAGGCGSDRGTGGMITKIAAADIVVNNGIPMIIANGENPSVLFDIFDGVQRGTVFLPKKLDITMSKGTIL